MNKTNGNVRSIQINHEVENLFVQASETMTLSTTTTLRKPEPTIYWIENSNFVSTEVTILQEIKVGYRNPMVNDGTPGLPGAD